MCVRVSQTLAVRQVRGIGRRAGILHSICQLCSVSGRETSLPSSCPTPSTSCFSIRRSAVMPLTAPAPGPPVSATSSPNSRCIMLFHFEKPNPVCTLLRANHAPFLSWPLILNTAIPRGFSFALILTGLPHAAWEAACRRSSSLEV